MSIKLTDMQIVMLSAAAQRDDRCLLAPQTLKGSAAQKVALKLIGAGLAKEIKAKPEAPVWRRDEQGGQSYALKLTAAGARATADAPGLALDETSEGTDPRVQVTTTGSEVVEATDVSAAAASLSAPRGGTEAGAGPPIASARLWRNARRTDCGNGLASAYHARCADRVAQTRLFGNH
jgi:hypothetical protein